ncbi:hypothetical protein NADFUDRAFT_70053 [Nadsonia fulvescens var. elongata DSM 6958]|uniref:Queuosine 5'-phosphate N-glycosylase/hydrolase n=1 Tax=Nadsonia fulvescens var. elongata DSM 6958 TaxID=857566 RepID=A0A1E3PLB6_9ASCO|nr:hypothetical protein NADFUDRAFT_70053 [Nadsonia fulvescens var. elongata DSM 6958]
MKEKAYSTQTWSSHALNPKTQNRETIDWIFLVDLLNFSFWSDIDPQDTGRYDTQRYSVDFEGELYTGYWSLCAAINRALAEGIPITQPAYWLSQKFTLDHLAYIFRSSTEESIPLLKERYQVLVEAATVLRDNFDQASSFADVILAQQVNADHLRSAVDLVNLIVANFPSFNDIDTYEGQEVHIYKRVQILVSDIWACFNGKSFGAFHDIGSITMFADYRVPQILHAMKCLEYAPSVRDHLQALKPLSKGSSWEIELRCSSIWAVELIRQYIHRLDPNSRAKINSILIDFYLWDTAKLIQQETRGLAGDSSAIACHRTRSIFY